MTLVSFSACFLSAGWTCTPCWPEHCPLLWSRSAWEPYTKKWWTKKWTPFPPSSPQVIQGGRWDLSRSSGSELLPAIMDCESCSWRVVLIGKNSFFDFGLWKTRRSWCSRIPFALPSGEAPSCAEYERRNKSVEFCGIAFVEQLVSFAHPEDFSTG